MKSKKIIFGIFFVAVVFSLCGALLLKIHKTNSEIKKIEYVYKKGFAYRKSFLKVSSVGKAKNSTCYSFLSPRKVKWLSTASYVINPNNPQGLSQEYIKKAIVDAAETWDSTTSKEIANDNVLIDYSATNYGKRDGKNVILFGNNYSDPDVIAATSVWYNTRTGAIVEFDISFETDYQWGDAELNSQLMDLQNIATHELGHAFGMGDVYEEVCSPVTMYGYSDYGETQKRTLEEADIKGFRILYGY